MFARRSPGICTAGRPRRLLHNVGLFVSHAAHHLHSEYVIRNSDRLVGYAEREIDLIAQHDQHLVFIEVRARRNPRFASPAASVDRRKQQKLLRAAQFFLQKHPELARLPCRFDVIAFQPPQSPAQEAPLWIRGAFTS